MNYAITFYRFSYFPPFRNIQFRCNIQYVYFMFFCQLPLISNRTNYVIKTFYRFSYFQSFRESHFRSNIRSICFLFLFRFNSLYAIPHVLEVRLIFIVLLSGHNFGLFGIKLPGSTGIGRYFVVNLFLITFIGFYNIFMFYLISFYNMISNSW